MSVKNACCFACTSELFHFGISLILLTKNKLSISFISTAK